MNRKFSSAILSTLLLVFVQGCWAKESPAEKPNGPKEADKAQQIKAILTEHKLEVWKGNLNVEQHQFCVQFYEDLKSATPKIKYIEPDVKTDDPNHPKLERYRNSCSKYTGPAHDGSYWNLFDLGDTGFRLYRLDFDDNPKNGEEELVYADRSFENKKLNQYGGFKFIDLSECKLQGAKTTRGYENIGVNRRPVPVKNVNALISIGNQYYAMELHDQKSKNDEPSQYKVELWELNEDLKFKQTCIVRWRPHLLKNVTGEDE